GSPFGAEGITRDARGGASSERDRSTSGGRLSTIAWSSVGSVVIMRVPISLRNSSSGSPPRAYRSRSISIAVSWSILPSGVCRADVAHDSPIISVPLCVRAPLAPTSGTFTSAACMLPAGDQHAPDTRRNRPRGEGLWHKQPCPHQSAAHADEAERGRLNIH